MPNVARRSIAAVACIALVGAGTVLAATAGGEDRTVNAAATQYGEGQGCTPGYWKNNTGSWTGTGFSPNDSFDAVFGVSFLNPSITLLEAAGLGGGGYDALARQAAAALLNSSDGSIDYGFSTEEVIALVKEAGTTGEPEPIKDELAAQNETTCPINAQGEVTGG